MSAEGAAREVSAVRRANDRVARAVVSRFIRAALAAALALGLLAAPLDGKAQQTTKIPRVGLLDYAEFWDPLRQRLSELGYFEGKTIVFEYRASGGRGERLPALARELVQGRVDVIVTYGAPVTQAAKQATTTIPIVMVGVGDPVKTGLVASLARPGGNITGSTILGGDIGAKRLQLLQEAIYATEDNPGAAGDDPGDAGEEGRRQPGVSLAAGNGPARSAAQPGAQAGEGSRRASGGATEMNRRERKDQERREWRRLWTRSWRPWTETHPAIEALTLKVKASGVEALNPANQDVWSYSARDVPFHECGNPNCSIGGIDLRPLVTEMIAERKSTFRAIASCEGLEGNPPRTCMRIVEVSGSISYKTARERQAEGC